MIKEKKNVIMRNLKLSKVLAENGDAIGVQYSTNVWLDHLDVSSDRDHDKDYYDGLIDLTHAADYISITNTYFHDHWKGSLVGHSDNNGGEDKGHLRVTYANNYWSNSKSLAAEDTDQARLTLNSQQPGSQSAFRNWTRLQQLL
jgi:pectate lyase